MKTTRTRQTSEQPASAPAALPRAPEADILAAAADAEDIRGYLNGIAFAFEEVWCNQATQVDERHAVGRGFLGNIIVEALDQQMVRLAELEDRLRRLGGVR
jgi:hypothetical protein